MPSHRQSRRVAVLKTLPRRKIFTLQIWKAGPSYPEPESPANSPSCPFPNFGCACVFSDDTCILFSVASSSPGVAQTLDSVTLSDICPRVFCNVSCCDAMTVWLFRVSSMIILCSAFGLHALHFTTGFCTLCIWCCIIEMQATFLFTKACQRTVPASQILSSQTCLSTRSSL